MSTGLLKVRERAKRDPDARFTALAHLLDEEALRRAYGRTRKGAAVGVDGITKEEYGQELEDNLRDLHRRLRSKQYRHQPILRVHIPKAPGKTRPIGISATEDKIVQGALREVLEAIYEQDFLDVSYGFRPERGAHDALRDLNRMVGRERIEVILEADDFVMGFESEDDARRVLAVLHKRMAKFGLTLHPEKTRLIPFARPRRTDRGTGPGTFDFLGFTMYWCRTRRGSWRLGMKTRKARIQKAIKSLGDWCRRHRHRPLKEQHAALARRPNGHFQYFGVNGNSRCVGKVRYYTERIWFKWLRRRSQCGKRLTWGRFRAYLEAHPLPQPRICVSIWA
jgi:hypothetical protein